MTLQEMITALEAKRAATVARMNELLTKSGERGETLSDQEAEDFETLEREIEALDIDLKRRKSHLARVGSSAGAAGAAGSGADAGAGAARAGVGRAVVRAAAGGDGSNVIAVRPNLEKGIGFARYAQALFVGKGNLQEAAAYAESNSAWMKSTPWLVDVLKTAVNAGDSTTSGWASELVYAENMQNEFIEFLRPMTILGKFGTNGITSFRRVPFNIRIAGLTAGPTGYWVGQGRAIPMSRPTTTSATLAIAKAAGLVAIDDELARLSTPSAETMVRDELAATLVAFLDDAFINPNNGGQTNISPASMTYGVTPVTPTGTDYAALRTDIQTLMETPLDAYLNPAEAVWIMSASCALKLSMMVTSLDVRVFPELSITGGRLFGLPVIVSQAAQISGSPQYADIIVLVHPQQILLADDGGVTVSVSQEASLQMDDAPTNQSTATATGTTVVSMFQTNSMAIKAVRYINWAKKRTQAAQWIQAAAYK